jgi:hypothetical protein
VRSDGVIELQVFPDGSPGFVDRLVCVEINLFILDGLPDPLDEHAVSPAALAVHADVDAVLSWQPSEVFAGELTALIGVEYLRFFILGKSLFQRFDAEGTGTSLLFHSLSPVLPHSIER